MGKEQIDRIRSFSRLVTRRIGVLDDSYLGRGRPLGQARLLFEVGTEGAELGQLRDRLGLDSGYISRLLNALATQDLLSVREDAADRRRRRVSLTAKGLAERASYDKLSDGFAASVLKPLDRAQRERLILAMAEVERLMSAAAVTIGFEDEKSEDARRCVTAYFRELAERFEQGFDPDSGGYAGGPDQDGFFLLARLDGQAIGCGALKPLDGSTGEIKRMWVAPEARGLGVARRILTALENKALALGLKRVILDTNRSLLEAQSMYRKAGYKEIGRYNDNSYADFWFEKKVTPEHHPGKSSPISR